MLQKEIDEIKRELEERIEQANTRQQLAKIKEEFLSRKKGKISLLFKKLAQLSPDERREAGARINELKNWAENLYEKREKQVERQERKRKLYSKFRDLTLPEEEKPQGFLHPISRITYEIEEIFLRMGYDIEEGPEVELDYYNFEALNIPRDHPARDEQDTFYIDEELLLRTHTSPVQIRAMLRRKPPIRIIVPGRVFRRDNPDATHTPMFFQVEGLVVDRGISFAHLKGTLEVFLKVLYGEQIRVRFRPSYFPFTEPSAEVDISCPICEGKDSGCRVCGGSGWIEILGAGMVHPNVLRAGDIDPEVYSGFAFGLGIDRISMLKYLFPDTRYHYENDIRFLEQLR